MGERVLRVTADSRRLQQVMDALGINDLTVPAGLDGHVVNVRVPPVVMIRYDHQNGRRSRLFQARTPQLTLPSSIDVRALGEIGLRILGLATEQRRSSSRRRSTGTPRWSCRCRQTPRLSNRSTSAGIAAC